MTELVGNTLRTLLQKENNAEYTFKYSESYARESSRTGLLMQKSGILVL